MPILPLEHPESLAATLGVMLYAGEDDASQKRARAARNLRQAKLRLSQACLEDIEYAPARKLDKRRIRELATCRWIAEHHNVVLTGPDRRRQDLHRLRPGPAGLLPGLPSALSPRLYSRRPTRWNDAICSRSSRRGRSIGAPGSSGLDCSQPRLLKRRGVHGPNADLQRAG